MFSGSQERKLQRRSVRSRSESERGSDPVPKKKTKKEQVSVLSRQLQTKTGTGVMFAVYFKLKKQKTNKTRRHVASRDDFIHIVNTSVVMYSVALCS